MRSKRIALGVAVACGFLLLGCGQTDIDKNRAQARQRWDQSRAEMVTKLAEGSYQRGEFGRANEHVAELIRAGVTYAPAHVLAARLAAQRGDLDKARERAVRLSPHEAKYVLAETELLVAQGKGDEAAKDLCEAVKRTPGRAELHSALGDVLSMLKLHGEAVGSYRAAMHLKPDLPGAKERLARALFRSGAYAEAEPLLAELAGAEPEFVSRWVRLMRADCLLAMGRAPEARTIYEAHRLLAPKTAAPLIGLAKCDILENHLALAGDRLEVVLAIQPQDPEAHALMGYVRVATGRPGEALAHLRLALDNPDCQGRRTVEQLLAQAEKVVTEF
ncbi:MAG: tetratricopeptide repeat protein [Planctomycetota bacterium]|nr:tetratricopeptide repeat protein [Planctomycetota bacterium]